MLCKVDQQFGEENPITMSHLDNGAFRKLPDETGVASILWIMSQKENNNTISAGI
jgi:hypothetical protein